jgi:transcription elongation GreA/GreB family factor
MDAIDKQLVLEALQARLSANLSGLVASQRATQSGATHEETRQEHPKETRAIEATYLARGLAERVESLEKDMTLLESLALRSFGPNDAIGLTALVGFENEEGEPQVAFLVPCAGGEVLEVGGRSIRCLTPGSPLGRALVERQVDDEIEIALPSGRHTLTISWIR